MKTYQYIIIAVIFILTIGIVKSCGDRKISKLEDQVSVLLIDKQTNDSIKNEQGKIILTQKVQQVESDKALKAYTDEIFNLKKKNEKDVKAVHAYYKNVMKVEFDTLLIPFVDTVYINGEDTSYLDYIYVPKKFAVKTTDYNIEGTVRKAGVEISKFEMQDSVYGRFIEKKNGLFKANTIEYQTFNTNKNIKIIGTQSAMYKPKKQGWNKIKEAVVYILIGTAAGLILSK